MTLQVISSIHCDDVRSTRYSTNFDEHFQCSCGKSCELGCSSRPETATQAVCLACPSQFCIRRYAPTGSNMYVPSSIVAVSSCDCSRLQILREQRFQHLSKDVFSFLLRIAPQRDFDLHKYCFGEKTLVPNFSMLSVICRVAANAHAHGQAQCPNPR